ncbi:hypothetical protein HCJ58_09185 [Listeria sp. FSL L7-1509]|uniref:Uncharacterized protein n=1 Tax=Listeria immobilis TaxID=2713502 RepID=A0ABR6SUX9_9LIST|nr:hypothetical protein [Listeria immobilis]MBC1483056.1 hypothetical protein [Listeria immobilis]MBC1507144.1 hypothetical protein [Listeria immobilis]MBC1509422.1 hypothetical protein [Listeria immobilis]MBC6302521.1 hypothetical protein [Listeria immobilis]MBC6312043.1 hypothetical protein [Listeria immobilis]
MKGAFTMEIMFFLTGNPMFQEVAKLVYWEKEEIIDCPENGQYVYAIDEGIVMQYAQKNTSWGKGMVFGFTREATKIQPLSKTVVWKIPLIYVEETLKDVKNISMESLIEIETNSLSNYQKNDSVQWFIDKIPGKIRATTWKIEKESVRKDITKSISNEVWREQLNSLKELNIIKELGYYLEVNLLLLHAYVRQLNYNLLTPKNN